MKLFPGIVLLLAIVVPAIGQNSGRVGVFNTKGNVAMQEYDPISYFNGNPKEGKEEFSFNYKGIIYYFIDAKNRATFIKSPDKYEPAYGGWCAYAMGETGEKVKVDPETYKIIDGRLYLFYNFWGNNTLASWNKNERNLKINADKNWTKIFRAD